jgi:hypothetical protein
MGVGISSTHYLGPNKNLYSEIPSSIVSAPKFEQNCGGLLSVLWFALSARKFIPIENLFCFKVLAVILVINSCSHVVSMNLVFLT